MNPRRTLAVARKELRHITRDSRSLAMALAVPLVMLLLFGYALTLDVDHVPTLIYDQDQSAKSRELIAKFQGSRYFEIRGFVDNYGAIEDQINKNRILVGVAIPKDYGRRLASGERCPVQILLDGSDSNTASIAQGYVDALFQGYAFELKSAAQGRKGGRPLDVPVDARLRVWYNNSLESKNYVVPGLIAVILMIIASLLTSLTIAREWEMGTMEQLLSTPLRPAELVMGKMVAFLGVGFIDTVTAVLVGIFVFRVPFRGNILLLMFTSFVFLFGALCWGIMLSAATRSQLLAYQLGMVTSFLPAFLLSGFVYSVENMPHVIQAITYIVPAKYFIVILKGIFLKGVGIGILWLEMLFLVLYAAAVFLLATKKVGGKIA
jgi:ABC-2 type transport system permease protein